LKIALIRLSGIAAQFAQMAKLDDKSFSEFKHCLISRFVPDDTRAVAVRQFAMCQQQVKESVQDFVLRLRVLGERTLFPQETAEQELQEKARLEKELLERFTEGFLPVYRAHVLVPYPQNLQQAIDTACVIEKVEKQNPNPISVLKSSNANPSQPIHSAPESPDRGSTRFEEHHARSRERSLSAPREYRSHSRDRFRASQSAYRDRSTSANRERSYREVSPRDQYNRNSPRHGDNRRKSPFNPRNGFQQRNSFTQWRSPKPGPATVTLASRAEHQLIGRHSVT